MTDATMTTVSRTQITAVGTRDEFTANVAAITGGMATLQTQMAQVVAFAFSDYHKTGSRWAIDHARAELRLSKRSADKFNRVLARIPKTKVPEGESVAKAALKFANDWLARFFGEETAERKAKAEDAAKTREAKKVAQAAAQRDEVLKELECTIVGVDGKVTTLTAQEYEVLMLELVTLRDKAPQLKAA